LSKKRKLVIEIPEEMDERRFYGLFGVEGWIIREPFSDYALVKTARCNWCGECCKGSLVPDWLPKKSNGSCAYLRQIGEKWECRLGIRRPRGCCIADPISIKAKNAEKYCSIRYKKVPLE